MTEKIELKGLWFLPESPENKIEGTLVFDPENNSILELTGTFNDSSIKVEDHEIILGFTTKGKEITLFNCLSAGGSMSFPGIHVTRYDVQFIFEGKYFTVPDELKFKKLRANIVKLEEWVNIWGFNIEFNSNTKELNTNFKIPASIKFKINENLDGQFRFSYRSGMIPSANYQIEQTTDLELSHNTDIWFLDFLRLLYHFKTFLTLGIYEDVYYETIEFIRADESEEEYIKLYFVQPKRNSKVINRSSHDFLFNFRLIEANFEQIIQKWYVLKETIPPVLNSLFASFADRDEFTETKFLNIIQALEIYHRRTNENTSELKADFQLKLEPILKGLTDIHKKWLIDKLAYKWEPNLRNRLKFLFRKFKISPLTKIIKGRNDLLNLINATVCSRNYYTHYDESLQSKAYNGAQLYRLTEKLKILLIIIILSETGFSNKEIEELFQKHEYRFFNHLLHNVES
jgi:hypothetical protein